MTDTVPSYPDIDQWAAAARARVPGFCKRHFGPVGTVRLHRAALGWDMLRAPFNILIALPYVLIRLTGTLLRVAGLHRAGEWLLARPILLRTAVAARVEALIVTEVLGDLPQTPPDSAPADSKPSDARTDDATPTEDTLRDYSGTRSAMADITTSLGTLGTGALAFQTVTPGIVSLAPILAITYAQSVAVAAFPLGGFLGSTWYWMFPAQAPVWLMGLAAVALATLAALIATFAGILADPVQLWTGLHRRRLNRLIDAVAEDLRTGRRGHFAAREHYVARLADVSDVGLAVLRLFRP